MKISKKRKLGAILGGLIVANSIFKGFEIGMGWLFPEFKFISSDLVTWEGHIVIFSILAYMAIVSGAITAGYIARIKGARYGIYANVPTLVGFSLGVLFLHPLWAINTVAVLIISYWGGKYGQKLSSETRDIENDRIGTLAGIPWKKWLWFWLPLNYLAANIVIFGYAILLDVYLGFYSIFHPSTWISLRWWFYWGFLSYFFTIPMWVGVFSFYKSVKVIQWNSKFTALGKLWRFLIYFAVVPILGFILTEFFLNYAEYLLK